MADEYDITDAGAVAVLSRAAECVDRIAAAQASIAERGEIVSNQYGEPKMNPACTLEKQARDGFFAAMRLLNLDEPPAVREAPWEIRR